MKREILIHRAPSDVSQVLQLRSILRPSHYDKIIRPKVGCLCKNNFERPLQEFIMRSRLSAFSNHTWDPSGSQSYKGTSQPTFGYIKTHLSAISQNTDQKNTETKALEQIALCVLWELSQREEGFVLYWYNWIQIIFGFPQWSLLLIPDIRQDSKEGRLLVRNKKIITNLMHQVSYLRYRL